ncbi:fatty acid synthase-like [Dermacentor albipictus]|uniref:fatty acid synthase-like n=1 Tax=Dermacentor albipictus TaxID=60249 RepID=UPI0038FD2F6C
MEAMLQEQQGQQGSSCFDQGEGGGAFFSGSSSGASMSSSPAAPEFQAAAVFYNSIYRRYLVANEQVEGVIGNAFEDVGNLVGLSHVGVNVAAQSQDVLNGYRQTSMADDDIVITGFSAYFPQADHLVEFKEKLYAGVDMITEDDLRWPPGHMGLPRRHGKIRDLSRFDAQFFSTHPKQAQVMDPQLRMLLETSYESIVDAGYDPETLRKRNIGVFIGNSSSESCDAFRKDPKKMDGYYLLGCSRAMFSNRISYSLDLQGPSMTIDTACSSAMVVLNEAVLALRSGRCEGAIVGAGNLNLDPCVAVNFRQLGVLSDDGKCKAFDSSGDGYVRSETVGSMFLQRRSDARRVYAKVININVNTDGYKPEGIPFPSAIAHEQLLRATYAEADVDPRKVEYVEAHGTGTKAGGRQELEAISNALCPPGRDKPLKVGSVKTNMGHAESACGIASVAKIILAMETGTIAANLHFKEPSPDITSLHDGRVKVVDRQTPYDGGLLGISSQGIGGTNVHGIFEPNKGPHVDFLPREKPEIPRLVPMAGRSKESLLRTLDRLEAEGPYPDSGYALLSRVSQPSVKLFPYRGFAIVPVDNSGREVVKAVHEVPPVKPPLWFVFTGMGCQWNGMARQMMHFDVFARSIRKSHALLLERFGIDLVDLVTSDEQRMSTMVAPFVAIVAIQVALVDVLHALGIKADGMVGHSVGEVGCAYADGGLTAEQAVLSSYWRGRCTELSNPPKGSMAAVGLTWEEVKRRCPAEVYPACHNSEDSVTVSGSAEAVAEMVAQLQAENIFARNVNSLGVAFHSKHVAHIGPILREALDKVIPQSKPRSKRWISSSVPENRWHEPGSQLCSAEYHTNNFLNPVLFRDALKHVPEDAILLEIGPHCLLQAILRRAVGPKARCLGLMKRHADNLQYFLSSLGQLHTLGVNMHFSVLYPPVPWPVPRGTPNIAHLVSWDHSHSWTVAQWKDFTSATQAFEEVIDIDLEADSAEKYLLGHRLDGRVILPGTGYIVFVWESLAKRYGKPLKETPVIFEDVRIQRATILPPEGSVRIQVTIMPVSGEFEVCESRGVVAKGRIRMAEEGKTVLLKEPPGTSEETIAYDMTSADVYKELRLRGYQFHGAFLGVLQAYSQKPCAKLKWEENWVTFMDALCHVSFLWNQHRTFDMPVSIQSCRIDPKVQAEITDIVGDKGVDAVYSPHLNLRRAGGVEIEGLKVNSVQRRPVQEAPVLEQYCFVPYHDNDAARSEREHFLQEYADVCCGITQCIMQSWEENISFHGMMNGCHRVSEELLSLYVENTASNHGLVQLLFNIRKERSGTASLASTVQLALLASKKSLEEDFLNTSLLGEDPLIYLLDVVLENTSYLKLRVLELAAKGSVTLMAPWVSALLSMYDGHLKTVYSIAHPNPDSLAPDQVPEGTAVVVAKPSTSGEKLPEADLVIASCGTTTASIDLVTLAEEMFSQCKEHGFVLISHRTALTAAEALLSRMSGVSFQVYAEDMTIAVFRDGGFRLVGLKSNNLSTLLLFRKVTAPIDLTKQAVVRLQNAHFSWVETLKEKVLEYVSKSSGEKIWLLAEDAVTSGILGFTNCLRQETGEGLIRCLFDITGKGVNSVADFSPTNATYKDIIENDLVMNVYRDGQWGSYRHRKIDCCGEAKTATQFAYLDVKTRGNLSSLEWYESPLRYLSPCDKTGAEGLICDVYYAPVNFRDIMLATGKINLDDVPGERIGGDAAFPGMEFSGRDPNGRRVMGMVGGKSIATVLVADPILLWEVPESWTLEEAATVPIAYSTAYYALVVRGAMQPGESLLVHSGSGGVGQAAIAIALSMGCTVFTTVGSEKKREFLKCRFPQLCNRHFANSRDRSFEEHIKLETGGRGVDLVLNSLSEDKLQASVRCLAPHGRFLEIGKFDLFENNSLGLSVFLKNVTFHGVMMDSLVRDDPVTPAHKRRIVELVQKGIDSGVVRPLDVIRFNLDETEQAFRFVASGKHIGKVVIQIRPEEGSQCTPTHALPVMIEAVARPCFYGHKSYVIVGGLGGFGLELAEWMVSRGCRKLLLISRTGVRTGYQRLCLHRWNSVGVAVFISNEDVSTEEGARKILDDAASMGPVGGIFNLAMVLRDAFIENQTAEMFEEVCKPKVLVTQSLDDVSRTQCPFLDHFVIFSSLASGRGNAGQANYGYANSVTERICERRVRDGLPGLAIQWGAIGDVGVLHDNMGADVTIAGIMPQPIRSCMAAMDGFLSQSNPVVSSFVKSSLSSVAENKEKQNLVYTVAHILGIKDASLLNPNISLGELGIDSLMSVEVRQLLERDYEVTLSMQEIRQLTVSQLREMSDACSDNAATQTSSDVANGKDGQ